MSTGFESGEFGGIGQGTHIVQVRNLDLAVCLASVGVRLRKDPPYTFVRTKDGHDKWTFNFEPKDSDGVLDTMDMVQAFTEDAKFIQENPQHPFTYAMVALKNRDSFQAHMNRAVPFVAFRSSGGATLYVLEGGKKHKKCALKGMVQL